MLRRRFRPPISRAVLSVLIGAEETIARVSGEPSPKPIWILDKGVYLCLIKRWDLTTVTPPPLRTRVILFPSAIIKRDAISVSLFVPLAFFVGRLFKPPSGEREAGGTRILESISIQPERHGYTGWKATGILVTIRGLSTKRTTKGKPPPPPVLR